MRIFCRLSAAQVIPQNNARVSNVTREVVPHFTDCRKKVCLPFDKFRANGVAHEVVDKTPFMLSPSKHAKYFFKNPLMPVLLKH